jgi:hypothetical protein
MSDASTDQAPTDATTQSADDKAPAPAKANGAQAGQHAPKDNGRRDGGQPRERNERRGGNQRRDDGQRRDADQRRDGGQRRDGARGNHGAGPGPGPGQRYESRDGSWPFERTTVRFDHGATVGTYDRWYDRYRQSFYHVTAVLQRLNMDDGIDLVQVYLQTMLDEAKSALREGKREVVAALEARTGSRDYPVMVNRTCEREARVPSYTCRQYLEVFRALDDYLNTVVYAESVGAISWRDRRTLFLNAPRQVGSIGARFMSVGTRLSLHDLQQAASAFDALKAVVAAADAIDAGQAPRSLALGQVPDAAPSGAPPLGAAPPEAIDEGRFAGFQAEAPPSEPSGEKTPRKRKGNGNGSVTPELPAEPRWT